MGLFEFLFGCKSEDDDVAIKLAKQNAMAKHRCFVAMQEKEKLKSLNYAITNPITSELIEAYGRQQLKEMREEGERKRKEGEIYFKKMLFDMQKEPLLKKSKLSVKTRGVQPNSKL